jgi:hypothetical protein
MAIETHQPPAEIAGQEGDRCERCRAPLAANQHYCLNCGARSGAPRVPFETLAPAPAEAPPPRHWYRDGRTWGMAAAGGLIAALLVGGGVLLGRSGVEEEQPQINVRVPEQKAPQVTVNNTGGGAAAAVEETFTSDWPVGTDGFTVQLETLPNTTPVADVTQAETEAGTAGATDVGSLDSDEFGSLDPGNYVIYSGVYEGKNAKAEATKALKGLKKDFPDAKVIKVSGGAGDTGAGSSAKLDDSALQDLEGASGEEQQKKSAQLPDETILGDEPPPLKKQPQGHEQEGGKTIE